MWEEGWADFLAVFMMAAGRYRRIDQRPSFHWS